MSGGVAAAETVGAGHSRAAPVAVTAVGLVALGLVFHGEVVAALGVWAASTAYNHCFLVLPIAAWLAWERRARWATPIRPFPWAALAVIPLALAWFAAERLGIMEGRQLAALGIVEAALLALLGWRFCRAFAAPLGYLMFLVPFGAFITPALQDFTTWFTRTGLDFAGIPNFTDGHVIEIPEGTFLVAEACAGLRFLIASIAYGALYGLVIYRSPGRRLAFLIVSCVVPVIANGFRAFGIVALGHALGSAKAAAADHVLYGWIFFSIVILLLTLMGLPFREDGGRFRMRAGEEGGSDAWTPRGLALLGACVVLLSAGAPVMAARLNGVAPAPALPEAAGDCTSGAAPDVAATTDVARMGPGRRSYTCLGVTMDVTLTVFSPRSGAATMLADARERLDRSGAENTGGRMLAAGDDARIRLLWTEEPWSAFASGLWLGGTPVVPGLALRVAAAGNSLSAHPGAPVLLTIVPRLDWGAKEAAVGRAANAVTALLRSVPALTATAARASAG